MGIKAVEAAFNINHLVRSPLNLSINIGSKYFVPETRTLKMTRIRNILLQLMKVN